MDAIEIGSSDEAEYVGEVNSGQSNHFKLNGISVENHTGSDSDVSVSPVMNLEDRIKLKYGNSRSDSQSSQDSDYQSQDAPGYHYEKFKKLQSKTKPSTQVELSSDDSDGFDLEKTQKTKRKGTAKKAVDKTKSKEAKEEEKRKRLEERERKNEEKRRRQEERERKNEEKKRLQEEREQKKKEKQEEAAKQKALKQLNSKNRLDINPEKSMKYMKVILDESFRNSDFFNDLLKALNESEVQFAIESQLVPQSITWLRKVEDNYINEKHVVCSNTRSEDEKQMLVIWNHEEALRHISDNTFIAAIKNIKSLVPNKNLSLVIYNIENYFRYHKNLKDRAVRDEISSEPGNENPKKARSKAERNLSALPVVSRTKFDECLVEIQLMCNVTCRLIENQAEMVLLIHQYTKSLAQLPSKLEKRQELSKMDLYLTSDNRDTVKVDSDGNGLKRLWQQQLCQFPLASLEIAEAISSVYKSPLQLMDAYKNCNSSEGESLLKDIPIRRAAGPITSTRRIGPELSKKIFIMFTSDDGEACFNN